MHFPFPAVTPWSSVNPTSGASARVSCLGKDPYLAIDGDPNGVFNQNKCGHTGEMDWPWFGFDVGSSRAIAGLVMVPRSDCCNSEWCCGSRMPLMSTSVGMYDCL